MDSVTLLALVDALVSEAVKNIQIPQGERGPRGFRGHDGNDFNIEDHKEEITNLVLQNLPKKIELTEEQREELRGPRGFKGADGNAFNIEDHKEEITNLVLQNIPKQIELTDEQREELRGPRGFKGADGQDGRDGKDFIFEDHASVIDEIIKRHSLKFEDLTDKQKEELKGRDGKDGKNFDIFENIEILREAVNYHFEQYKDSLKLKFDDLSDEQKEEIRGHRGLRGADGRSFVFEEHKQEINDLLKNHVEEKTPELKLKFQDLSQEEIDKLRGPRGQRGKPGRDFNFEESKPLIDGTLKSFVDEKTPELKLKFSDLTPDEKNELKLKFEELTFEERQLLRGPRGQRGKQGIQGEQGEKGEKGDRGETGPRGAVGPIGLKGERGLQGPAGKDGRDGKDAPVLEEVSVAQRKKDAISFVFEMSDGSKIESNTVKIPTNNNYYTPVAFGSGGSGGAGTANPTEFFDEGLSIGTAEKVNFSGTGVSATKVGDTIQVQIDAIQGPKGDTGDVGPQGPQGDIGPQGPAGPAGGGGSLDVSDEYGLVVTAATNINFIGDYVKVRPRTNLSQWNPLSDVEPSLADYAGTTTEVDVYIDVPDSSIIKNVSCAADVYVGAFVKINAAEIAENALADSYENSNVFGLVESKSSTNKCDIRVSGISSALFSGLDSTSEYYLSDTVPGAITKIIPSTSNHVKLKLGQPFGSSKFLFAKGERVVRL